MPYNTRRKSLSLPSLGIQLPHGSRAAHRSPPATSPMLPPEATQQQPPTKKIKRSHISGSTSPSQTSPPHRPILKLRGDEPKSASRAVENTPPPSPGAQGAHKVDTAGMDDDIVVAVVEQLEKTGNRPHLLKELAAVLSTQLAIVESSANQSAIISSRLTTYLRRPWSALRPCPVGKELIGTHPKRIFFYLTTCPHQPFPDPDTLNAQQAQARTQQARIISPSLSSAANSTADHDESGAQAARSRDQLSPSPELDLDLDLHSAHLDPAAAVFLDDIDMDADPDVASLHRTYSGRVARGGVDVDGLGIGGSHPPTARNMAHNRRAVSPPLEGDEREFTQTASELQMLLLRKRAEEREERERRASREISLASGASASASGASAAGTGGPATPKSAGEEPDDDADVRMDDDGGAAEYCYGADAPLPVEESEETCARKNSEAAAALFGFGAPPPVDVAPLMSTALLGIASPLLASKAVHFASSPLVRPAAAAAAISVRVGDGSSRKWSEFSSLELRSPETVDLDELDDLFDSY